MTNTTYQVGALSKALTKVKRKDESRGPDSDLQDLFAVAEQRRQRPLYVPYKPVELDQSGEKRKRWADDGDDGSRSDEEDVFEANAALSKKRKKRWPSKLRLGEMESERDDEEKRTVFVGNLSNKMDRKAIRKLFKICGQIDTVRIRSVALADPGMPRKVGTITRDFHPKRNNLNAYVRFRTVSEAEAALKLNGTVIDKFHLRVDMANKSNQHPNKRSIFLGNLPFDIEEETLHSHFEDCGEIESVRLVRDTKTSIGKGFGFVTFKTADPVELALRLDGTDLDGRGLRVSRAVQNPKKNFNATKVKLLKKAEAKTAKKATRRLMTANAKSSSDSADARKSKKSKTVQKKSQKAGNKSKSAGKKKSISRKPKHVKIRKNK